MVAVNWGVTKKVTDQSCHTATLNNDGIQKTYVVSEQQYPQPKTKTEYYIFKIFKIFYFKIPFEAPIFTRNKLYQDDPNG